MRNVIVDCYVIGLYCICRNVEKTNAAADDVRREVRGADIAVYKCDLSSLKSVRACAEEINAKEERVDVLINNAGAMMCPYSKGRSLHM